GKMLRHFIQRILGNSGSFRMKVVLPIPAELTQVERRALVDAAYAAEAAEVYLVERIVCAAVGLGLPVKESRATMIVDVGEETTEIMAISRGRRVSFELAIAGTEAMK